VKQILLSFGPDLIGYSIVYVNGALRIGATDRGGERYEDVTVSPEANISDPQTSSREFGHGCRVLLLQPSLHLPFSFRKSWTSGIFSDSDS
jgi:hypothetical protein